MAKKFAGFTEDQALVLLNKVGYTGQSLQADEVDAFLASSPAAQAKLGQYAAAAQKRFDMLTTPTTGYAEGGETVPMPGINGRFQGNVDNIQGNFGGLLGSVFGGGIPAGGVAKDPNAIAKGGDLIPKSASGTGSGIPNWIIAPPPGTPVTSALVTHTNPVTGEVWTAPTGGYSVNTSALAKPQGVFQDPNAMATALTTPGTPIVDNFPNNVMPLPNNVQRAMPQVGQATQQTYLPTGAAATYNPMSNTASFDEQYQLLKAQPYVKDEEFWKNNKLQEQIDGGFGGSIRAPGALSNMYKRYGLTEGVDTIEDVKREYELYNRASQNAQAAQIPLSQPNTLDTARQAVATAQDTFANLQAAYANIDPLNTTAQAAAKAAIDAQQIKVTQAQAGLNTAQNNYVSANMLSPGELQAKALSDPLSLATTAPVATITGTASQKIDPTTGQLTGFTPTAALSTALPTTPAVAPVVTPAATITPTAASVGVQSTLDKLAAATGMVGPDALVQAATMTPDQLAALGLTVEQIDQARTVVAPAPRVVQQGELITGSTVDMAAVDKAVNFEAATGAPSSSGTVQGQLTSLMQQFEGDATPAWAAGAMRAATAALASRGLGASSMAGQAIIQATMEAALPIAMQDAQTNAGFELQNLSNRQATAMFGAQQRATFLGMEFDQNFQTKVANASRISDIANMNFSADQQIALENARMAQTVDLTNMSAKNAKIMADAATLSQMDMTNLNNRQQAAVTNAQSFLQMDMANLDKEQQTAMFKSQSMVNTLLSDNAAANAAKQFNATSENQTNQFFAGIASTIAQFNVDQENAMQRFNAGEANTIAQFNSTMNNQREQFNSQNSLIVEQANAQWSQTIATTNNAAINAANRDAAQAANGLTNIGYNNLLQGERDIMSYVFQTANNNADRATQLALGNITANTAITNADKNLTAAEIAADAAKKGALAAAAGSVLSAMFKDTWTGIFRKKSE
jgi:hypothetical protein